MANLIPQIGATGKYQLQTPFDAQIKENAVYTCIAVRRLGDFVSIGRDPKALYYDANELGDNAWERDSLDPDVCIVTLVSKAKQTIYVPTTYILSYPDLGGIPYTVRLLGINLGAIPDTMDLSNLITSIENLVKDTVGIESTAQTVAVSETKIISQEDHETIEDARLDLITVDKTDRATVLELQAIVQAQLTRIQELEQYIVEHTN